MKHHFKEHIHQYIIAILTVMVLSYFFMTDGAIVEVDTQGYINMSISREAGYSLFLWLFRTVFGEGWQLFAVLFQMLLLAFSICTLTFTVVSMWCLKPFSAYVIWLVQICFLLLCRFGSAFQAVYASLLLTEGLTYPLYTLYAKTMLQLNRKITGKRLVECLIYCIFLSLIRTQLMVSFFALIGLFVIKLVFRKVSLKACAGILLAALAGMLLVTAGQRIYIKTLYGVDGGAAGSSSFLLTAGLYGADENDAELFPDEEERYIFEELYGIVDEWKANHKYEPENGFLKSADYYLQNFDVIKFDITNQWFYQYFKEKGLEEETEIILKIDEVSSEIGIPLFLDNIGTKLKVFMEECVCGYMRTIAKCSPVLVPFVLIAYGIYITLMFINFKNKENAETGWDGFFVLMTMTGNIFITAFMIFCEPRYVLYNMVPFYVMGYIMLVQVYRQKKERQSCDSRIMSNNME